jgi:putative transposase
MSLYRNKYRNESSRKAGFDYGSEGSFFITFNTIRREPLLGEIRDGKTVLSEFGKIVEAEWLKSFEMRNELNCEAWVIMPDHMHAILTLQRKGEDNAEEKDRKVMNTGVAYRPPRSVSSFIACFKAVVTKKINDLRATPAQRVWQPNYHDHIIRNEDEKKRIKKYIENNPSRQEAGRYPAP